MKVAILASAGLLPSTEDRRVDAYELDEQMQALKPAFDQFGLELDVLLWQTAKEKADQYDLFLPLLVWDYVEDDNPTKLIQVLKFLQNKSKVLNDVDTIIWNSNKNYLQELQKKGAPTIESIIIPKVSEDIVNDCFDKWNTDKLVIKPLVGANAWRQILFKKGDSFPSEDELPPSDAIIQPFLKSVQEEGEYSFIYFSGEFSHAVKKCPKKGDYRIQSTYGGFEVTYNPTNDEIDMGKTILQSLENPNPLYVRVDLLRGSDGNLKLIELEMIEPYLYLPYAPKSDSGLNNGALMLGKAIQSFLKK